MCIIIASPDGSIPTKEIAQSLWVNPDGWGYMFAKQHKIVIRKGISSREFWRHWKKDQALGTGPLVFHARIATQGKINLENCHPFMLAPRHKLAVAHNGMISMPYHKKRSDTNLFVEQILDPRPTGFLREEGMRKLLELAIGSSKLAFLDSDGNITLIGEHRGGWVQGRWYSNTSCFPAKPLPLPAQTWSSQVMGFQQQRSLFPFGANIK